MFSIETDGSHNKNTTKTKSKFHQLMSKRTREESEMEAGPSTASPGASASLAPAPPAGEVQLLKVPQVSGQTIYSSGFCLFVCAESDRVCRNDFTDKERMPTCSSTMNSSSTLPHFNLLRLDLKLMPFFALPMEIK